LKRGRDEAQDSLTFIRERELCLWGANVWSLLCPRVGGRLIRSGKSKINDKGEIGHLTQLRRTREGKTRKFRKQSNGLLRTQCAMVTLWVTVEMLTINKERSRWPDTARSKSGIDEGGEKTIGVLQRPHAERHK